MLMLFRVFWVQNAGWIAVQLQYACPHSLPKVISLIKCFALRWGALYNSNTHPLATPLLAVNRAAAAASHTQANTSLLLSHALTLFCSLSLLMLSVTCLHIARAYLSSFFFHSQSVLAVLGKRLCLCICVLLCACVSIFRINLHKFWLRLWAKQLEGLLRWRCNLTSIELKLDCANI